MVTPTTTEERLRKILVHADGFLYLVALLGLTGARGDLHPEALHLIRTVRSQTDLPVCVGFGISQPEHVRALSRAGADGAIVGSAVVNLIARNLRTPGKMAEAVKRYVRTMKKPTLPAKR